MYLLGYDIGSSSVKASLVEAETGRVAASDFFPKTEMTISAPRPGWAEQMPDTWWDNLKLAHASVMQQARAKAHQVLAIGISYQMHGLVLVDKAHRLLRPAIIWCDSRAVPYGERALHTIGQERALQHLLNSPGNFTASKLAWVRENEPHIFEQIDRAMLPGDYIALRLTGQIATTVEGLSEGILWDFRTHTLSDDVLRCFGIPRRMVPDIVPLFGMQGAVSHAAAAELGLKAGTPVAYRAGDQPNNALSLGVFRPGEIASTAGTSGVVYGISDRLEYDTRSRVNIFAHVNYTPQLPRLGVLLCINGTGILNAWLKRNLALEGLSYADMNTLAAQSPVGARGVSIIPFGNGAERVLENRQVDCSIHGINFNIHDKRDLLRAAQEGIVFSYEYGMQIMRDMGMHIRTIKAGYANMFLSPLFAEALATLSGATVERCNTDGAAGAAKAAGIGIGFYSSPDEAFATLECHVPVEPQTSEHQAYREAYQRWKERLLNSKFKIQN